MFMMMDADEAANLLMMMTISVSLSAASLHPLDHADEVIE
jgi:hypothetical protein